MHLHVCLNNDYAITLIMADTYIFAGQRNISALGAAYSIKKYSYHSQAKL